VGINSFDNHEFHIAEHTEFQKTSRYDGLGDQLKMIFDAHVAAHRTYMVNMVNQQIAQQAQEQQAAEDQQLAAEEEGMAFQAELDKQQAKESSA
jgi:hypothetical protein